MKIIIVNQFVSFDENPFILPPKITDFLKRLYVSPSSGSNPGDLVIFTFHFRNKHPDLFRIGKMKKENGGTFLSFIGERRPKGTVFKQILNYSSDYIKIYIYENSFFHDFQFVKAHREVLPEYSNNANSYTDALSVTLVETGTLFQIKIIAANYPEGLDNNQERQDFYKYINKNSIFKDRSHLVIYTGNFNFRTEIPEPQPENNSVSVVSPNSEEREKENFDRYLKITTATASPVTDYFTDYTNYDSIKQWDQLVCFMEQYNAFQHFREIPFTQSFTYKYKKYQSTSGNGLLIRTYKNGCLIAPSFLSRIFIKSRLNTNEKEIAKINRYYLTSIDQICHPRVVAEVLVDVEQYKSADIKKFFIPIRIYFFYIELDKEILFQNKLSYRTVEKVRFNILVKNNQILNSFVEEWNGNMIGKYQKRIAIRGAKILENFYYEKQKMIGFFIHVEIKYADNYQYVLSRRMVGKKYLERPNEFKNYLDIDLFDEEMGNRIGLTSFWWWPTTTH